jgi:hypothetical protein
MHQPSTAPSGAQCARHPGVAAPLVCGRCGAFMCVECSLGGSESLCPACRELVGSDGFPYRRDDFDFSRLWNHSLEAFQRDWLMLSVGALIFFALALGGSLVSNVLTSIVLRVAGFAPRGKDSLSYILASVLTGQVFGTLIGIAVQGVALVGFYRLTMDAVLGRRVDIGRMFSQLRKLPTYVVTQLILIAVVWIPSALYFVVLGVVALKLAGLSVGGLTTSDLSRLLGAAPLAVLMLGILGYIVVFVVVLLPMSLFVAPEIVVSDAGALEALRRAWNIGRGMRLPCLGYSCVFGLLVSLGALLCLVPVLPAMALGGCLLMSLFLAARNGSGLPAPDHT